MNHEMLRVHQEMLDTINTCSYSVDGSGIAHIHGSQLIDWFNTIKANWPAEWSLE